LAKARTQLAKTQPGYVKGKFGYLAPEQLTGEVDARTDVFALGLCLYEATTQRPLFNHETAAETISSIKAFTGPPSAASSNPAVWPELDRVIQRALSPQKEKRFASAAEMRNAIEKALIARDQRFGAQELRSWVRELFPDRKPLEDSIAPPTAPPSPVPLGVEDLVHDLDAQRKTLMIAAIVAVSVLCLAGAAAILYAY
jgi:serine/threonine-protein kinase